MNYSAESALTLELALEYPGSAGTMTLAKRDLHDLRRLTPRIDTAPPRDPQASFTPAATVDAPKPAQPKAEAPQPEPDAPATPDKDAEELRNAQAIYAKFPSPDWGADRHTVILQKRARGQVPTPAERESEPGYPALWEKGRPAAGKN